MSRWMDKQSKRLLLYVFIAFSFLSADTRGKLTGLVTAASDGTPLVGVNIFLPDLQLGSITDENGYYIILNIPPGAHTVKASYIGYKVYTVNDVRIVSDQTTQLDFVLESAVIEGEEVVVTADRPLVQADLTSSKTTITEEEFKVLPTETFQNLLSTKAGVTQGAGGALHIRGGRSSEVLYMVDGIPVPNPFTSGLGVTISTSMISELTLVSGTFNAEYGKAMSGVVNLVTRDGRDYLEGEMRYQIGDMHSRHTDVFDDIDQFEPLNFTRTDLSLSGPLPLLAGGSFVFTGTRRTSDGWLYGWKEHNTFDISYFRGSSAYLMMTGDSSRVPMNPYDRKNMMTKVTMRPWKSAKLTYQLTGADNYYRNYEHRWKYNPNGQYQYKNGNILHALHYSQTLSDRTYFTLKGAYRKSWSEQYVHELQVPFTIDEASYGVDLNGDGELGNVTVDWEFLRDYGSWIPNPDWYSLDFKAVIDGRDTTITINVPQYVPNDMPGMKRIHDQDYHFYYGGQHTGYFMSDYQTYTLKFDLTSQVTARHQLRMGFESNLYSLHSNNISIDMSGETGWTPKIQPISVPDHRHDEYTRTPVEYAVYLQDKIELESIIMNVGMRYDYFDSQDSTFSNKQDPVKDTRAAAKSQISPRLGVSFPITDQGYIHFSYGHFFQMPGFSNLYRNPDLKHPAGVYEQFGNPDLEPQKNIMYEIGLQQQLNYSTAIDVTMFYRNVLNWLSSEYNYIDDIFRYTRYVTQDYGNIRGITIGLVQRAGTGFSLNVDYTYQFAEGSASDPDEAYYDNLAANSRETDKRVVPLDWDVRHTANATIAYNSTKGGGISLITRYSSGLPFTPSKPGVRWFNENTGRKLPIFSTDLNAYKNFQIGRQRLSLAIKVYNLFDKLNERYVFTNTGRSGYSLDEIHAGNPVEQYPGVVGIHSIQEYLYSPANYRSPRQILASIGWSF